MATKAKPKSLTYADPTFIMERLAADLGRIIATALSEDLGIPIEELSGSDASSLVSRDITSWATIPATATAKARMLVKAPGVVAGLEVASAVFHAVDPTIVFKTSARDGDAFSKVPTAIAEVNGPARSILIAERTALNLIQRMSGIATITRRLTEIVEPAGIRVVDTRKTTPGLRALEKYAVAVGGGTNHRYGLFDAVLIKDNHISIAGGITQAVTSVRKQCPGKPVEVEVSNIGELKEALAVTAETIMLDNMSPQMIAECVSIIAGRAFIEVSGGVTADTIEKYLVPGVDAISIGALTHSVRSLDISLEIEVQ